MALDPRDTILRSQEDKKTGADPRDPHLFSQEDKVIVAGEIAELPSVTLTLTANVPQAVITTGLPLYFIMSARKRKNFILTY